MRTNRRGVTKTNPSKLEEELARQIKQAKLVKPKREYKFHPTRRWRLDFAWPKHKLAVEVEGGLWLRGRHNRPAGMIADMEKYTELSLAGWTLVRVADLHINDGTAIEWIKRGLK